MFFFFKKKTAYDVRISDWISDVCSSDLTISGSSTSNAAKAPFIDFYLLLDTSPSMLLPSTSAGLSAMRAATGCAFACHTMQPHDDNIYVRDNNGQNIWLDNAMVPRRITGTQTISGKRYVK